MKLRLVVVTLLVLTFAVIAIAEDKTQAAQAASEAWLKFVDSGDYSQSWVEASSLFKAHVTQKDWERQIGAARLPLGALFSRTLKSAQYSDHSSLGAGWAIRRNPVRKQFRQQEICD